MAGKPLKQREESMISNAKSSKAGKEGFKIQKRPPDNVRGGFRSCKPPETLVLKFDMNLTVSAAHHPDAIIDSHALADNHMVCMYFVPGRVCYRPESRRNDFILRSQLESLPRTVAMTADDGQALG